MPTEARPPSDPKRPQHTIIAALASPLMALALGACDGDPIAEPTSMPCGNDADCDVGLCGRDPLDPQADLSEVALVCRSALGSGEPRDTCQSGHDCRHGLCILAGTCVTPCNGPEGCDDDDRCGAVLARTDEGDGLQHVSACVPRVSLGDDAQSTRAVVDDAASGSVDTLLLPGTDRPSIYVLEHESDHQWPNSVDCRPPLCALRLAALDGADTGLYDIDTLGSEPPRTPIAQLDSAFPATVYVGNGPDAVFDERGYALTFASEQPGDVAVTRIRGKPDVPASGGRIDLNVFYAGALDWQPTGSRGPDLLADALDVVDGILEQADIFVGEVRQFAVPGDLIEQGTTFDASDEPGAGFVVLKRRFGVWPELPALLALSAGAPGPAINLFFVGDIEGMGSGEVRALAGGTPGPLGMHGTGASGIAVATDMMTDMPAQLGRTLAHEICHYLGLFHTSERNGEVLDPFEDTASCTIAQDQDGDGFLNVEDCNGLGNDNLMFWANTMAIDLSPEQIAILQQAAVLVR